MAAAFSKNGVPMDKICDNCGDVGYAENIATCYRCNKNSEHTYCMQSPPNVVPKYWQCDDCTTGSNGKSEKRKTILLDAMEARKSVTPNKRFCSFLPKDSKQFNGFRRQPPSARHSSLKITDALTSKGKGKTLVSCTSLGVLSTPTIPRNIRFIAKSRATRRMPVYPASRPPATHSRGTNRASELSVAQSVLTSQIENIGSEVPNAHCRGTNRAREPSVGQGILTTQTKNIRSRAPDAHSRGTNRASEPSVTQSVLTAPTENIRYEAPNAHCRGTNRAREPSVGQGILTTQTENIGSRAPNAHSRGTNRASEPSVEQGVLTTETENIRSRAPNAYSRGRNRASEPSVGQGVLITQTENIGTSSQHNETAENRSAVHFLGNARAGTQIEIDGHQNSNPQPKLLLTTEGMLPHHPVPNACWTGDLEIFDLTSDVSREIKGIHAHIPSIVSLNVYETMKKLRGQNIKLKLLQSLDIWPTLFNLEPPRLGDVGLFFFPSKEQRLNEKFICFVNMMDKQGLAMKGCLPDAKLLIFTSSQLPSDYHGIVPGMCLWGVLRHIRPKKQSAPGQEKLNVNSPISGNATTNGDKNHATESSSRSRSGGTTNARANGPDAPGFLEPICRNRAQRGRQSISYSPVLFSRDDVDAPPGFSPPPGFSKTIYRPKRS